MREDAEVLKNCPKPRDLQILQICSLIFPDFPSFFPRNMFFAVIFPWISSGQRPHRALSRASWQVVRAAVKQNGSALIFASGELRNDRGVVAEAPGDDGDHG